MRFWPFRSPNALPAGTVRYRINDRGTILHGMICTPMRKISLRVVDVAVEDFTGGHDGNRNFNTHVKNHWWLVVDILKAATKLSHPKSTTSGTREPQDEQA